MLELAIAHELYDRYLLNEVLPFSSHKNSNSFAIIAGARAVTGHGGHGGEVGHMVVRMGGRECPCGRRGCGNWRKRATPEGR